MKIVTGLADHKIGSAEPAGRTPLHAISAKQYGPVVRRLMDSEARPARLDVAAFNSSI